MSGLEPVGDGVARISWRPDAGLADVRERVAAALEEHGRVEAHLGCADTDGQRLATWSGLRREGVRRHVDGDVIVYARLATDAPVSEPGGFRALLNSFLPRKRAIAQMVIRDKRDRVLICELTYKTDWDLPGGVVEPSESPSAAVSREVAEELGLTVPAGRLLLTDWLPPWGGWDDAVCLVFDGGEHPDSLADSVVRQTREIRSAGFYDADEIEQRCAAFTARRIAAALAALHTGSPSYTESGRPPVM